MSDFFSEYFVKPIIEHSGYNIVNTVIYAIIALIAVYGIYKGLKRAGIKIDQRFIYSVVPFILLGSTIRVVTDSIDTGAMGAYVKNNPSSFVSTIYSFVIGTHIYDYGYLTTSPGIFVVIAVILLLVMFLCHRAKRMDLLVPIGVALLVPHFLLLIPMFTYILYGLAIALLAALVWVGARFAFERLKVRGIASLAVLAHALDGGATFIIIDFFNRMEPACTALGKCYGEQHVLTTVIGTIFGTYLLYFVVKVLFSFFAAYVVEKEKATDEEKNYVLLLLVILGLAPGMRDLLRVVCGA